MLTSDPWPAKQNKVRVSRAAWRGLGGGPEEKNLTLFHLKVMNSPRFKPGPSGPSSLCSSFKKRGMDERLSTVYQEKDKDRVTSPG